MTDPFSAHFSSEVLGARDFAMLYGFDRDIILRISQFGMHDCRDPNRPGSKIAKPVVFFVEHRNKPMFLSKTKYVAFFDRFGPDYWLDSNRDRILYAPVQLVARKENIGGTPGVVVNVWEGQYPDHLAKIGASSAAKLGAMLKEQNIKFDRQTLRNFVAQEHHDILHMLDAAEGLADLPWIFRDVIDECIAEIQADLSHTATPPQDPKRESDPRPPEEDIAPPADFSTPEQRKARAGSGFVEHSKQPPIGHDDIPF